MRTLFAIVALTLFAGCINTGNSACPGYERISYGSGCIAAGHPEKFVDRINCEECGA